MDILHSDKTLSASLTGTTLKSTVGYRRLGARPGLSPQPWLAARALRKLRLLARYGLCRFLIEVGISTRWLVKHDLLFREHYAFGLFLASVQARNLGLKELTVVELGVGGGAGLLNLCYLTRVLKRDFDITYHVVGFDMGTGLPAPVDYKDHPEIWRAHQFAHDQAWLQKTLPPWGKILYGPVGETVAPFLSTVSPARPLGFVVLDLDYYSSSKTALDALFTGPSDRYLPAVPMYVDDVDVLLTYNNWCGEALALNEFNREQPMRKIDRKRVRVARKRKYWHNHIFCLHVLDHPERKNPGQNKLGAENEINVLII